MEIVRIRERKGEFQVYEKATGKIVFRAKSEKECNSFLANQKKFIFEATPEHGVNYVF